MADEPGTCAHGDHQWRRVLARQWPPSPSDVWVTGDGVWHRWVDGQGWVHDEAVAPGTPIDVATNQPAVSTPEQALQRLRVLVARWERRGS